MGEIPRLWLDDVRLPPKTVVPVWVWAENADEALRIVLSGMPCEAWSLDHDLGENVPTGNDFLLVVESLLARGFKVNVPEIILVHSANPVGRKNMEATIRSIRRFVEQRGGD